MKKRILLIVLLCVAVLFTGCVRRHTLKDPEAYLRLVVRVDVDGQAANEQLDLTYTHQEKMEAILNYLRLIPQKGPAQGDPEQFAGDSYTITLHFSDGHKQIYRQHADRFLSTDAQPWRNIDSERAALLYPLLKAMPSDYA